MARSRSSVVAERLHRASLRLLRLLRLEDVQAGIAPARSSALSVLVFAGAKTLGELAAAETVRPPTMSRVVAALVRAGLVARRADAGDGRRVILTPTPAGRRLMLAGRDRRVRRLDGLLRRLSAEEIATLDRAAALIEGLLEGGASGSTR